MFNYSLEKKLDKAFNLIKYFDKNKWEKTLVSFSGGKDSSLLIHLIFMVFKKIPFRVIFFDHGFHFEETLNFLRLFEKKYLFKSIIIKKSFNFCGKYIFKIRDEIENFRVKKIEKFILENNIKYLITGHKKTDSNYTFFLRRKMVKNISKIKIDIYFPLFDFTDGEILFLIRKLEIPFNHSYFNYKNSEGTFFSINNWRKIF